MEEFQTHSKKSTASYSVGSLASEFVQGVLAFMLFYFYEAEVGLDSLLVGLALAIYAVWDAINDPLVGYLTDRPFKFTKKWGRRFPWMLIAYIPMLLSFILIFSPPSVNAQEQPMVIFGWLVFTTCLFDTLESIFTINYWSLFPDKFRLNDERRNVASYQVALGWGGVFLTFVLPPLIIVYGEIGTFGVMAWVCVAIAMAFFVFMIPGIRDDKEKVEKYLQKFEEEGKESFFKALFETLKLKSFIAFMVLYVLYGVHIGLLTTSFLYWTNYVIQGAASDIAIVTIVEIIGALIGIPIWLKFTQKSKDNRKTMILTGGLMAILTVIFFFINSLMTMVILILIFGITFGGFWLMLSPVFSDVVDDSIATTGKRREGMYGGFRFFFSNLGRVVQALTLAFVHELTGFVEGAATQSPTAVLGIQIHFGIIPAIYLAVGILVFWKFYDITPEKTKEIKAKIAEMEL